MNRTVKEIDDAIAVLQKEREVVLEQQKVVAKAANPGCTCSCGISMHGRDGCFSKNGHDIYCSCSAVPVAVQAKIRAELVERYKCAKHQAYVAAKRPSDQCEGCWRLWVKVNP